VNSKNLPHDVNAYFPLLVIFEWILILKISILKKYWKSSKIVTSEGIIKFMGVSDSIKVWHV
jgi:hypothetical protein